MGWHGRAGAPLPSGAYSFEVESYQDGRLLDTTQVPAYGHVAEARADETGVTLVLDSGAEVPVEEVGAVRLSAPG